MLNILFQDRKEPQYAHVNHVNIWSPLVVSRHGADDVGHPSPIFGYLYPLDVDAIFRYIDVKVKSKDYKILPLIGINGETCPYPTTIRRAKDRSVSKV